MNAPIDPVRDILREYAHQILAAAAREGAAIEAPVSTVAGDDLLTVTILLSPATAKNGSQLTACERDALAVIEASETRLTRARVCEELDKAGRIHGESTIAHALCNLVRLGILRSSRRAPCGYYLAGKSYSLFSGSARS